MLSPAQWCCSSVNCMRDSPTVHAALYVAAAVASLCLHYTYRSYATDCYSAYIILYRIAVAVMYVLQY